MDKKEALEKYGDVPLSFSNYYKYSFTFSGTAEDGATISVDIGGNADDIYRFGVSPDSVTTLKLNEYFSAMIRKDGEELWSEYTY